MYFNYLSVDFFYLLFAWRDTWIITNESLKSYICFGFLN